MELIKTVHALYRDKGFGVRKDDAAEDDAAEDDAL